jgi:sugar lactone lactonase YvrE
VDELLERLAEVADLERAMALLAWDEEVCMPPAGAVWTGVASFDDNLVGRVREGGQALERVRLGMPCFACMLGGEDRRTLFMLTADWGMSDRSTTTSLG